MPQSEDRDDTPQLEAVGLAKPIRQSFLATWPNAQIHEMVVYRRKEQPSVDIRYTSGLTTDTATLLMSDGGLQACFPGPLTPEQLAVLETLASNTN